VVIFLSLRRDFARRTELHARLRCCWRHGLASAERVLAESVLQVPEGTPAVEVARLGLEALLTELARADRPEYPVTRVN